MKRIAILIAFCSFCLSGYSQNLYFPPLTGSNWDTVSIQTMGWCNNKVDSLYEFLETENTKAFILLKDGKIVLEKYFAPFEQHSTWYWASAGKVITAFLIGIAQQEGSLTLTDSSSKYLGKGWTKCTPEQEDRINILHQLTMTTGLDDGFIDNSCTMDTCLLFKADADSRWAYHNAPYTLLDKVIEESTGLTLNAYVNRKLKPVTGMTGAFVKLDYNNVYFSNARSMARFGLLILNNGKWEQNQLITDIVYFNQMVNNTQQLNESYGYLWWLNGKPSYMVPGLQSVIKGPLFPNAPSDMISALGKNGQFLNIVPSQNLVMIRMGDNPSGTLVPFILNDEIWAYVNELNCDSTNSSNPLHKVRADIDIYPNPAKSVLTIKSGKEIKKIELINTQGQIVKKIENINNNCFSILINSLPPRIYFAQILFCDNEIITKRISLEQ